MTCESCGHEVVKPFLIHDPKKKGGRLVCEDCLPPRSEKFPYPIARREK